MVTRNEAIRTLAAKGVQPEVLADTYGMESKRVNAIVNGQRYTVGDDKPGRVYRFLVDYMTTHHGLPPSVREIMIGAKISSTSMVVYLLRKLADKEKIVFIEGSSARNFYLPGATWTPPQA